MKADAACPTAEGLTGPSPGADMDGGVLLCQLVEGVSTFSHREQEFHILCLRAAWSGRLYVRGHGCHRRTSSR